MGDEPRGGGLERGGGQRMTEVRLVEPDDPETLVRRVGAQPGEGELIGRGQNHQGAGGAMPVSEDIGMADRELKRRMCRLTSLGARRKIGTGDQVEAGDGALAVRHAAHPTAADQSR